MPMGAASGMIRVGNDGGKVILNYNGTPAAPYSSPPAMTEAKGFSKWVFQATDAVGNVQFSATAQIDGTLDAATSRGQGNKWFKIGDISNEQSALKYDGPLLAVRATVTQWTSGNVLVEGFAVP